MKPIIHAAHPFRGPYCRSGTFPTDEITSEEDEVTCKDCLQLMLRDSVEYLAEVEHCMRDIVSRLLSK